MGQKQSTDDETKLDFSNAYSCGSPQLIIPTETEMADEESPLLTLPLEVLESIWRFCDRRSLHRLSVCSKISNYLLTPVIFENICIKWDLLKKDTSLFSFQPFMFTSRLRLYQDFNIDYPILSVIKERNLVQNFKLIIDHCDPSKLCSLSIADKSILNEDFVTVFQPLTSLKVVTLKYCMVVQNTIKSLSSLEHLRKLTLSHCRLRYQEYGTLYRLHDLCIEECVGIDEENLKINEITGLQQLTLRRNYSMGDVRGAVSIRTLNKLVELKYLDISGSSVSYATDFLQLKVLKHLKLCDIICFSELCLDYLPQLTELYMNGCRSTNSQLKSLQKLKCLRILSVAQNGLLDLGLVYISQLVSLKELDISNNKSITNEGIKYLKSLVSLEKLNVSDCYQLTVECLIYIDNLSSLKKLYVENTILMVSAVEKNDWKYKSF